MEYKQNIGVLLHVREIMFDIMNKTHLTGHAREAGANANYEAASNMQASEDEESSYQLRRSITNAFSALKVRLGEYLDESTVTTENRINATVDNIDLSEREILEAVKAKVATMAGVSEQSKEEVAEAGDLHDLLAAVEGVYHDLWGTSGHDAFEDFMDEKSADLRLRFKMPSNFHKAAVDSLGAACHQYIVDKAISDWFIITNPGEAATYTSLAEEALETSKRALYKRKRPDRPSY